MNGDFTYEKEYLRWLYYLCYSNYMFLLNKYKLFIGYQFWVQIWNVFVYILLWYCFHKNVMMLMINCWLFMFGVCQLHWETMAALKTTTTLPVFLLLRRAMGVLPGSVTKGNMFFLDLSFLSDCSSGLYFLTVTKCVILNLQTCVRQKQCFMNISLRYTSFGFCLNYCMPLFMSGRVPGN